MTVALFLFVGCSSKDEQPEIVAPVPLVTGPGISSFSPSSGPVGTAVIIIGSNFAGTPDSNTVRFGGKRSVVDTASTTRIVTSVPVAALTGPISVTVDGFSATGQIFTVTTLSESPLNHITKHFIP